MSGVTIHLNQFEGPLGLLLYLIRKEEMDIMNINIYNITGQYLSYIKNMSTLDLENAGDFVAMAATLIHIKSRMLLPDYAVTDEEELSEDPRKELVQKLLDYEKYKEASVKLYERTLLNRDVWIKGGKEPMPDSPDDTIWVEDNALFSLITTYRKVFKRAQKAVHRVSARMQSVASRILELKTFLNPGSWISLFDIMQQSDKEKEFRSSLLITFLSLLELGKLGFVKVFQSETYGDIHIEALQAVDKDIISQVEEYEVLDNEEQASGLFAKASMQNKDQIEIEFENDDDDPENENKMATDADIDDEEKELGLVDSQPNLEFEA